MSKRMRFLTVVVLALALLLALGLQVAAQPPAVQGDESPEAGRAPESPVLRSAGAFAAFNNPNYYYTYLVQAPANVWYRQGGLDPSGTKLVAQKSFSDGTARIEIVLMDADGANERIISGGDSGTGDIYGYMNPFWSDDGQSIGYTEVHQANPNRVLRYDLGTTNTTPIYEPVAPADASNPDFVGASTTTIVFWAYGTGGNVADLFIWDGATLTNITDTADYKEYEPVSNADGSVILFWSGESTLEPTDHTHTLTNSGGVWTKDVNFTPISGTYWSYWARHNSDQICTTKIVNYSGTVDVEVYDNTGAFVADLSGPGYTGGDGQWNFFGPMPQGPNGEYVIGTNAGRGTTAGRDLVMATPRSELWVDDDGSDNNPGTEAAPFATIAKALAEVAVNGVINVADGVYTPPATTIAKAGLTIIGESQAGTILDVSGVTGQIFMQITAADVTLQNLTIDAQVPHYTAWPPSNPFYGVYVSGPTASNLALTDVTVKAFGKSGVNLNGANGVTLTGVTSMDNGGAGVFCTDCHNVTFDGVTTANNQWTGVAINTTGQSYAGGTAGMVFTGTNSFGESAGYQGGLMLEEELRTPPGVSYPISYSATPATANVTIQLADFGYALHGPQNDGIIDRVRFYQTKSQAEAAALHVDTDPLQVVGPAHFAQAGRTIEDVSTGLDVDPATIGVQAVLSAAQPGDTLVLPTGTLTGGLTLNVPGVTIIGEDGTIIGHGSPAFTVTAADVTIQNVIMDGDSDTSPAILVQAGGNNLTVEDCEIREWADGIEIAASVESLKIMNNWIHSNTDAGLQVNSTVLLTGIVSIEGNLFKNNGGNGVQNDSGVSVLAEYNSWGSDAGPASGDGISVDVDADPWTYVELYTDMEPDTDAATVNVLEDATFAVKLKVDAVNLQAMAFALDFDDSMLTLNSVTFAAPFDGGICAVVGSPPTGTLAYRCTPTTPVTADGGTVATLSFTADGAALTGNGPWIAYLDIAHDVADTSAGAPGGAKLFVNNAGYDATAQDISDTNDGQVNITGGAKFKGFADLQGRANDSGATVSIYNQQVIAGATLVTTGVSASSGAYTSAATLNVGTTYWLVADATYFLPTTPTTATDFEDSKVLTTRPLTSLANVKLLGGDATNNDEIDISDLAQIGGDYGKTTGFAAGSDGTADGKVDILDLALSAGNYDLKQSPWTP